MRRAAASQNGASAATLVGVCWQCRGLVASPAWRSHRFDPAGRSVEGHGLAEAVRTGVGGPEHR